MRTVRVALDESGFDDFAPTSEGHTRHDPMNQHIGAGGTRVDDGMAMPLFDRVGSVRGVEIASRPEGIDGQQSRLPRQWHVGVLPDIPHAKER